MRYALGGIGQYGTRAVVDTEAGPYGSAICTVEMPRAGIHTLNTIELRRAARDEKANLIVEALNAFSTHKVNEDI